MRGVVSLVDKVCTDRRPRRLRAATLALAALAVALPAGAAPAPARDELAGWRREAARVEIVRDDWGIAHVYGHSDADAVFGMIYAQAEDDFNRIETNYLGVLGRLAEAEGETALCQDLRARLFIDPADLQKRYATSPPWLRRLTQAWADGLNWYLATHPEVRPRVLRRFEPWMPLAFSEGSIGGDIERIDLKALARFYDPDGSAHLLSAMAPPAPRARAAPTGSNGIAIAPSHSANGHALLLINPHTSFYFRSELHMRSDQGLDAYGAATWGQFFIYQGFNAHAGWMHTSSGVDVVDEFAETIVRRSGRAFYRYGRQERPLASQDLTLAFRTAQGGLAERHFTVFRSHHGPVVRAEGERWITTALMFRPVEALMQSFLRTKAHDYADFLKVARLQANSSNNTIFADSRGEIAYLHPQFIPRRDDRYDYTHPVDGANPATDWGPLHRLTELPQVISPPAGWVMNTNDWPYAAAGEDSPKAAAFPRYMDTFGENPRGLHAAQLLRARPRFSLDELVTAAFDSYLPAFAALLPGLVHAYDTLPPEDPQRTVLAGPVSALRAWDRRWSADSVATTLAVLWGESLWDEAEAATGPGAPTPYDVIANRIADTRKLAALAEVTTRLEHDFGRWNTPWGEVNRFQRTSGAIVQPFDDSAASIPVPFTSGDWGSLASFEAPRLPGVRHHFGTSGNSFVAAVEFGPRVRAVAVTAGGESGHPESPHFDDQALRYSQGGLRPVYFQPEDLQGHIERRYHPGENAP